MQKSSSKGFRFLREIRSLAAGSKSLRKARHHAWLNSADKMHYDDGHKLDVGSQEVSKCEDKYPQSTQNPLRREHK